MTKPIYKWVIFVSIFISLILSIELQKPYYFDFYELGFCLIVHLLYLKPMLSYIQGKSFFSFDRISKNENPIWKFYGFAYLLFIYGLTLYYFFKI